LLSKNHDPQMSNLPEWEAGQGKVYLSAAVVEREAAINNRQQSEENGHTCQLSVVSECLTVGAFCLNRQQFCFCVCTHEDRLDSDRMPVNKVCLTGITLFQAESKCCGTDFASESVPKQQRVP
jgi:hypothetical protein